MTDLLTKFKESKAGKVINRALNSIFFPFVTAGVVLFCYYLSLDVFAAIYIGITGTLVMLLSDDVTPILTDLLFLRVILSKKNSPSPDLGGSDYYSRPEILVPLFIAAGVLIASMIYRLVKACLNGKFTFTPVFYGLCGFCASLILNGFMSEYLTFLSFLYGIVLTILFLGLFTVFKDNIAPTKKSFENIAYTFTAYSALLVIELFVLYLTTDGLFTDGVINRGLIYFGWGPYTSYGVLLVMCIPAVTYLAGVKKYGYVFSLYSVLLFVATFMCCSRQAILSAVIVYPICVIILLVKGSNRIVNLIIAVATLIAGGILLGVFKDEVITFAKTIFANVIVNGKPDGSGRIDLWMDAIEDFKSNPFFGVGFYKGKEGWLVLGERLTPNMYHNTIFQMLGSCGLIGLAAYVVHRVQTVICYAKNVTVERTFIALIILVLLINSLLDIHLFNIFPTMTYSFLLAMLVKSEKKQDN